MLGAIIGDIVGSRFEFNPTNDYNFEFWTEECDFTDDTICTVAIADALLNRSDNFGKYLHEWCRRYPNPMGAYGGSFKKWIESDNPQPYNSFGNGSAMRVSPVAWAHKNLFGALPIAARTAECTHNHPEGIKGAQTVTVAIHKAIELKEIYGTIGEQQMKELLKVCVDFSGYNINIKKEDVINKFDVTCQGTVPVALWIIGQSNGFEDAVRKAVSLGADADTLGAIVGSIAEAIWGIPDRMVLDFVRKLPNDMMSVVLRFYKRFVKESILHGYGDEGAAKDLMLDQLDRRDGTYARFLVKDFIDEKLGGDIEGLMDYDFGEILGDEKYGMYKGASCQIEKCDIVKAIMSLVLEDTWPILNMDSLDDYTYNCGYVNSMQYLFGSNIGDQYFMSMRNFNPSEELVKQAVEVSHLQKHIGNFWVMPGHIDSNKETYHYHGLTDLWLKALSAVLADEKKVDYDLKGVVYNARQQMNIYQCANGFRMLAKNMMLDSYLDENGNPKDVLPHVWANMKGLKREEYLDAVEKYIVFMKSFILKRDEMMVKKLEKVLAQDNETQKNYVKNMLKKEKDNEYSKVGYKFVKAIKKIVSDKDTEDKRELFETLDRMRLEKGYKLGLKLALDAPLDMESWFFTYKTKPNVIDDGRTEIVPEGIDDCRWIFSHIKVERSTMGAWQAYLYNLAPTIMPTFDHGNYIKRKLIFGHKDLKGIKSLPFDGDAPLYGIKDELMPKVRIRGNEARIEACYWSEFYGLTKEKVVVKFAGEMILDIKLVKEEVLIAYNCGILY